ncbi:MAG: sigma-70 family RNA polymerase sigma factor [Deltaproteobacteria bacterium]|nr:sigma-70 family RNA polymerase sigma factor [Deltaproteobacteria bacterium]
MRVSTAASAGTSLPTLLEPDVLAASQGDQQAFGRLVEASANTVCSISLAIVRNVEASEDIAQNVYLAAWQGLGQLRNPSSFLPWLRQMTRNQAHRYLRDSSRRRSRYASSREDDLLASVVDPSPQAQEGLERQETEKLLAEILGELPDSAREVITLFYREGRSVRQVSQLLDLSEAAVKQRLSRARRQVRAELLERAAASLANTAPGALFASGVLTALATAAPAASAAGLSVAGKATTSLLAKLGATLGSILLPAAVAIGASEFGIRKVKPWVAEEEQKSLRKLRWVSALSILGCVVAMVLGSRHFDHWSAAVLPYLYLVAQLAYNTFVWVPRLMRRRWQEEIAKNPDAVFRHQRERRAAFFGWLAGALSGGLGLALGLIF